MRYFRNIRTIPLCLVLILAIGISACAIFQSDPTGASLVTMRNGYEAVIQESGRAYQAGAITQTQLAEIVGVGHKFHDAYVLASNAYLLKQEKDVDKYKLEAARLLASLQDLARKYFGYGGATKA